MRGASQGQSGCYGHGEVSKRFLVGEGYMPADIQDNKVSLTHMLLLLAHCTLASMLHKGMWANFSTVDNHAASGRPTSYASA